MGGIERGRLRSADSAPVAGEIVERLVSDGHVSVEHILSGRLHVPLAYDQDHDEWFTILEGAAELEVDGDPHSVTAGDWLLIPRAVPHRVLYTEPGTRWLAVHFGGK